MVQALFIVAAVLASVLGGTVVLAAVLCGSIALVSACHAFVLLVEKHSIIVGGFFSLTAFFSYATIRYSKRKARHGFDVLPPPKCDTRPR